MIFIIIISNCSQRFIQRFSLALFPESIRISNGWGNETSIGKKAPLICGFDLVFDLQFQMPALYHILHFSAPLGCYCNECILISLLCPLTVYNMLQVSHLHEQMRNRYSPALSNMIGEQIFFPSVF